MALGLLLRDRATIFIWGTSSPKLASCGAATSNWRPNFLLGGVDDWLSTLSQGWMLGLPLIVLIFTMIEVQAWWVLRHNVGEAAQQEASQTLEFKPRPGYCCGLVKWKRRRWHWATHLDIIEEKEFADSFLGWYVLRCQGSGSTNVGLVRGDFGAAANYHGFANFFVNLWAAKGQQLSSYNLLGSEKN